MKTIRLVSAAALLAFAGPAFAQTSATATADLNVRSGPGPQHGVIGVINANNSVTVNGCIEGSKWCSVTHDGAEGWVYSDYLTGDVSGSAMVLTEARTQMGVPVVTYDNASADAAGAAGVASGAATGAIAGALIAGPIGAAVGGIAGAATGGVAAAAATTAIDPPEQVRTYVTTNRMDPVYLEGEVVVGAGLPETVELQTIPDYDYRYVYVNGQPVLVDANTRQIVYVLR